VGGGAEAHNVVEVAGALEGADEIAQTLEGLAGGQKLGPALDHGNGEGFGSFLLRKGVE
jgi:hypothetical protein